MLDSYHSLLLIIVVLVLYGASVALVKKGSLSLIRHRRIWNYLLLISFLASGILGLVLAFFMDNKWSLAWYREYLWLHVETGIIMAIISFLHIAWHGRYFWPKKTSPGSIDKKVD